MLLKENVECNGGYKFIKSSEKLNLLMSMIDKKALYKTKRELEILL